MFFDLAFVTAVAQLTGALAHHYDAIGSLQFVVALLLLWWTWLGHTFHATRFDEDRPDQHLLGMAQIGTVVVIAYGAGAAFGERGAMFAAGMAALKLLLLAAYLRERRRPGAKRLAGTYGLIYGMQVALCSGLNRARRVRALGRVGTGTGTGTGHRLALRRGKAHARLPAAPGAPARALGLFAIIVMGEGVASALHALLHAGAIDLQSGALALLGLAMAYFYWVGYFERARSESCTSPMPRPRAVCGAGPTATCRC